MYPWSAKGWSSHAVDVLSVCSGSRALSRLVSLLRSVGSSQSPCRRAARGHRHRRPASPARGRLDRRAADRRRGGRPATGRHVVPTRPARRHELRAQRRRHAQRTLHQAPQAAACVQVVRQSHRLIAGPLLTAVPSAALAYIYWRKSRCSVRIVNQSVIVSSLVDGLLYFSMK